MIQLSLHIGSSVLWLLEIHGSIFVCHRDGEGEATSISCSEPCNVDSPSQWRILLSEIPTWAGWELQPTSELLVSFKAEEENMKLWAWTFLGLPRNCLVATPILPTAAPFYTEWFCIAEATRTLVRVRGYAYRESSTALFKFFKSDILLHLYLACRNWGTFPDKILSCLSHRPAVQRRKSASSAQLLAQPSSGELILCQESQEKAREREV